MDLEGENEIRVWTPSRWWRERGGDKLVLNRMKHHTPHVIKFKPCYKCGDLLSRVVAEVLNCRCTQAGYRICAESDLGDGDLEKWDLPIWVSKTVCINTSFAAPHPRRFLIFFYVVPSLNCGSRICRFGPQS